MNTAGKCDTRLRLPNYSTDPKCNSTDRSLFDESMERAFHFMSRLIAPLASTPVKTISQWDIVGRKLCQHGSPVISFQLLRSLLHFIMILQFFLCSPVENGRNHSLVKISTGPLGRDVVCFCNLRLNDILILLPVMEIRIMVLTLPIVCRRCHHIWKNGGQ